jgi:hypothetical protein
VLPDPTKTPAAIVEALERKIDQEYPDLPRQAPEQAEAEDVTDAAPVDPGAAEPTTVEPPD